MKNKHLFFIAVFISVILMATCTKKTDVDTRPGLYITLKDTLGNAVAGATVRLYKNVLDTGIIKISDSAGVVYFTNLDSEIYYWLATKGCKTNLNSQTTLNRKLIANVVLYGYSVLTETGTLSITNATAEPYKVTTDSVFTANVYIDTPYLAYPKIGTYLIHTEKLSTPGIGKDTLVHINCGDTVFIRLPL